MFMPRKKKGLSPVHHHHISPLSRPLRTTLLNLPRLVQTFVQKEILPIHDPESAVMIQKRGGLANPSLLPMPPPALGLLRDARDGDSRDMFDCACACACAVNSPPSRRPGRLTRTRDETTSTETRQQSETWIYLCRISNPVTNPLPTLLRHTSQVSIPVPSPPIPIRQSAAAANPNPPSIAPVCSARTYALS
ncbi:hypothetical protein BKA80DRAFT_265654 [Phyllosticta citrichinensis]